MHPTTPDGSTPGPEPDRPPTGPSGISSAADPELAAMQTIAAALEPLTPVERARVIRWATARFPTRVPRDALNG